MVPDIFWTPFEMLYLIMSISMPRLVTSDSEILTELDNLLEFHMDDKPNIIEVKFNNMDYDKKEWRYDDGDVEFGDMAKIIYTDDSFFGNYDLAEKLLKTEYTNVAKP